MMRAEKAKLKDMIKAAAKAESDRIAKARARVHAAPPSIGPEVKNGVASSIRPYADPQSCEANMQGPIMVSSDPGDGLLPMPLR